MRKSLESSAALIISLLQQDQLDDKNNANSKVIEKNNTIHRD